MLFLTKFSILVVCFKLSFDLASGGSISPLLQKHSNIPPEIFTDDSRPHNTQQILLEEPKIFSSGPSTHKSTAVKSANINEPPNIFPTGPSILEIPSEKGAIAIPPFYFPNDSKTFKIIPANNVTALKILQEHTDLKNHRDLLTKITTTSDPKNDVEIMQPNNIEKQNVELEERYQNKDVGKSGTHSSVIKLNDNTLVDHPSSMHHGHLMGIIAGLIAVICLGAFAGLVFWKRYLERKYGKRERLVNEDEYCDERIRQFQQI